MEAEMRSVGGRFIRRPSFWLAAALVAALHREVEAGRGGSALAPGLGRGPGLARAHVAPHPALGH